jgi:hypothetical protein
MCIIEKSASGKVCVPYFRLHEPITVFTACRIGISCKKLGRTANIISCVGQTNDATGG